MKFFTPDLINRFGSDDDRIALAAQQEFEERSEKYLCQLHEIEGKLPQRFRELLEQFYLHDAQVKPHPSLHLESVASGKTNLPEFVPWWKLPEWDGENGLLSFSIALQLDTPPREILVLQYRSAVIERAITHQSLRGEECPELEWLYDEVELTRIDRGNEFRHSILFTRGLELQFGFKDFDFAVFKSMEIIPEFAEG